MIAITTKSLKELVIEARMIADLLDQTFHDIGRILGPEGSPTDGLTEMENAVGKRQMEALEASLRRLVQWLM